MSLNLLARFRNASARRTFSYAKRMFQAFSPNTTLLTPPRHPPPFSHPVSSTFKTPSALEPSCLLLSKSLSRKSDTKPSLPVPIKVVTCFDLQSLSILEYEEACKLISYRFPLVDRHGQSVMRRTVRDSEFSSDRNFLFVKVTYGDDFGGFFLLFCTKTTDLVGLKLDNKRLIVFEESLYEIKGDLAVLADVSSDQIVHVDVKPSEAVNYLLPFGRDFKNAVMIITEFLNEPSLGHRYSSKRYHLEQCLGFLYDIVFRGVISAWTKSFVIDSLVLGKLTCDEGYNEVAAEEGRAAEEVMAAGEGMAADSFFSLEPLFKKKEWEEISSVWFLGNKKWGHYDIEEEVFVVKASKVEAEAVPVTAEEHYDHYKKAKLLEKALEKAQSDFEDDLLGVDYWLRRAVLDAWEAAKAGFDKEEFFVLANYPKEVEEKARWAFEKATKLYFP